MITERGFPHSLLLSRDADNVAKRGLRAADCRSFNVGKLQELDDDVGFDSKRTVAK
jgi:hypothetical protein